MYFSWFLTKGQCLPPSAFAQLHVVSRFYFPWKNLRPVKTWKWESVCADRARSCFINPRKQKQQPLALSKGTFLHPALLGCRTMTELHTHTHTMWPLAWIFSVCSHTNLLTAGWALWSLFSACFTGSLSFLHLTSNNQEALILKVKLGTVGSQEQEGGRKRGSRLMLYAMWPTCRVFWG